MTAATAKKAQKEVKPQKGEYLEAVGRRKTAVARVRLYAEPKGKNEVVINGKPLEKYFPLAKQHRMITSPFRTLSIDAYEVSARAEGGGVEAQAEAIRLGIARALVLMNADSRARFKALGYLTRDPRMVERKHPGKRKARRPQQWRKR